MRTRWVAVVSLVLVLALAAGCKERKVKKRPTGARASSESTESSSPTEAADASESTPTASARKSDDFDLATDLSDTQIEVISDNAQVDAARKAYQAAQEKAIKALYADPRKITRFDRESMDLIKSQKDRSIKALTRMRDASKVTERRIAAAAALKELGVQPDPEKLVAMPDSTDSTAYLLQQLGHLYNPSTPLPPPVRKLILKAAESQDHAARELAGQLIARYHLTEAADLVTERVRAARRGDVGYLRAAALLRPSAEVLDILEANMGYDSDRYYAVSVIAELAKATRDQALRKRAAETARDFLKQKPNNPFMDDASMAAVETVATAVPKDEAVEMLTDVVRAATHRISRLAALIELNKLDPGRASRISQETEIPLPEASASAVSLTAQEAAAVCVKHKLLTQEEADAAVAARANTAKSSGPKLLHGIVIETSRHFGFDADDEEADHAPADDARGVLHAAKRFTSFNVQSRFSPNRHDRLILSLSAVSGGRFKPEMATEDYVASKSFNDEATGTYTVRFIHGGKLYQFQAKDYDNYYDLPGVLTAVNRALIDAGGKERFVPLHPSGQVAELVFANPAALRAAAGELGLTLSKDADAARKKAISAEEGVIEELQNFEGF